MPSVSAYLFLELAVLVYVLGFCWEQWRPHDLFSRTFWRPAIGLAAIWFTIDQIALALGLWAFPPGATLNVRLIALPIEEIVLFFLHTFICFLFVKRYWGEAA
jgi:lycopene cyclase domain-containing protein